MKSGQVSEDVIKGKADRVGAMLRLSLFPSQEEAVSSAATFIHHGYITEVDIMALKDINLSEVAHASALADVSVSSDVWITNVTGNIAPLLSAARYPYPGCGSAPRTPLPSSRRCRPMWTG